MESLFLSFIIPAYNAEPYIKRCLDSILAINNSAIEIIVINDGSEDKTENILKEYEKRGIKYKNISNSGVSAARNTGLAMASGKYITFVDADDAIVSHDYESLLQTIVKSDSSDLYMFGYSVKENGKTKDSIPFLSEGMYGKEEINQLADNLLDVQIAKRGSFQYMGGKAYQYLVKREFFQNRGLCFPEELPYAEDLCYCLDMFSLAKSITVSHKVVYNYHVIAGSASHRTRLNWWQEILGVLDYIQKFNLTEEQMNRLYYFNAKTIITNYANSNLKQEIVLEKSNEILSDEGFKAAFENLNYKQWTLYERIENLLMKKQKTVLLIYFKKVTSLIGKMINRFRNKERLSKNDDK